MKEIDYVQESMFDINHENPVDLIEKQYQTLFGEVVDAFEKQQDVTARSDSIYFTAKTKSIRIHILFSSIMIQL